MPIQTSARALRLVRVLRDELDGRSIGAKLDTEAEIAAKHYVSRTMVREALGVLRGEGLIESRRGSGSYVAAPDPNLAFRVPHAPSDARGNRELFELRAPVERSAAVLAAIRRQPSHILILDQTVRDMVEENHRIEADYLFHRTVAAATGNPLFERFIGHVDGKVFTFLATAVENTRTYHADQVTKVVEEHARILEAIRGGDADRAGVAMTDHLVASARRMALMVDGPADDAWHA